MLRKSVTKNGKNCKGEKLFYPNMGKVEMIQMLIPLGIQAVEDMLQQEIEDIAGKRYDRSDSPFYRWGHNDGSVYLGDQKVAIEVPRVRNGKTKKEVPLESYSQLQNPHPITRSCFKRVLNGISNRKYASAAEMIPETFGISKSSVSRHFIRASAQKLDELMNRNLHNDDIVAIFVDGKYFGEMDMIIALGITTQGDKKILGIIEGGSENERLCKNFFQGLIGRGLKNDQDMLFIIDGSKGMRSAIKSVFGEFACVQRCQWHKCENILSYLAKVDQKRIQRKVWDAYKNTHHSTAKAALVALEGELKHLNISAVNSLREGLDETLTLHTLGLFHELGGSFRTTNCIENINSLLGKYTDRVSRWRASEQRHRWVASALLAIEPGLRKVNGWVHLKDLRIKMAQLRNKKIEEQLAAAA